MSDIELTEKNAQLEQDLDESRAHEKSLSDLLEKKLNEVYIHYHISRTIGSLLDLREMLRQVFDIIQKSLPFERVSVYLLDEKQGKLDLVFHHGLDVHGKIALRVGEGTPGRIVENGEHAPDHNLSVFYETFSDFVHIPGEEKLNGSYIGIALKAHNTTIGVIGMDIRPSTG